MLQVKIIASVLTDQYSCQLFLIWSAYQYETTVSEPQYES